MISPVSRLHRQVGPQGIKTVVPVPQDETKPGRLYPVSCWGVSEQESQVRGYKAPGVAPFQ